MPSSDTSPKDGYIPPCIPTRAYQVLSFINLFRKRYDLALAQVDRALHSVTILSLRTCPG